LRLGARNLRRQGAFRGERGIDVCLRAGGCPQEFLGAIERHLGIAVLSFQLLDVCLARIDLGLKRRLLQLVEQIPLLDLRALDEHPPLQESGDARDQRHPSYRLNPADELVGLGDLLALGAHDADRWRPGRCGLGPGADRKHGYDQEQGDELHERPVSHPALRSAAMPSLLG
jgi:hypothetical protein